MIGVIQPTTTKILDIRYPHKRNNISRYSHFVSSQDMEGLRHHVVQLECCGPVSVYVQVVHDDEEEEDDDDNADVMDDHDGADQTARCQDLSLFTSRFYQTR